MQNGVRTLFLKQPFFEAECIKMMTRKFYKHLSLALVAAGLMTGFGAQHADALKLTMRRVIFEEAKRNDTLTIINDTAEDMVYRLEWRTMRMDEGEALEPVPAGQTIPGLSGVESMVVFAPKRITLAPGASQQIRLMVRKPKDLADGEYRSHLWVRPEESAIKFDTPADVTTNAPTVQIKMLAGITVPVFVRQGKLTSAASITDAKLARLGSNQLNVSLTLNREGNRSLYGNFDFVCLSGEGEKTIHQVRGIAVYTEIARRTLDFTMPVPAQGAEFCTSMRVTYLSDPQDPVLKGAKMAEVVLALP